MDETMIKIVHQVCGLDETVSTKKFMKMARTEFGVWTNEEFEPIHGYLKERLPLIVEYMNKEDEEET